ncbi:nucleotidyltransferase family protein [Akkermansiaceae bacterium]|nr:nucleotidyltransferase family protein [Akkermansiaceae bacterium]
MKNFSEHIIKNSESIKQALIRFDILAKDATLFVVDELGKLQGSLTDGDVRRGLLNGVSINELVVEIIEKDPKVIFKENYNLKTIIDLRTKNYKIIPVLDHENKIINIVNFSLLKSYLPIDAIIMAGGEGSRLLPLTSSIPKPLVPIGDKPIMEHNINWLSRFGIDNFWISVRYLGEKIENYFGDGKDRNVSIDYVWEDEPIGTIGALSKIKNFKHHHILVSNSDILTNLDYEAFYLDFLENDADLSVLTIPYDVEIPYGVMELNNNRVNKFKEKPKYTYYANGGIYLIKREMISLIPNEKYFDATDLVEKMLANNKIVISFCLAGYWLDIGRHEDLCKARKDISNINFN